MTENHDMNDEYLLKRDFNGFAQKVENSFNDIRGDMRIMSNEVMGVRESLVRIETKQEADKENTKLLVKMAVSETLQQVRKEDDESKRFQWGQVVIPAIFGIIGAIGVMKAVGVL